MTNKPKAIGTACETAVVRYLVPNGFDGAERTALHGSLDEGDVTGTPGVAWEVKGGHAAETASDGQVDAWLVEAEVERVNKRADVAVLVLKRKGKGAPSAGQWWAVLPGWAFVYLARSAWPTSSAWAGEACQLAYGHTPAVRMTLADAVALLRHAGYGTPITEGSAA